MRGPASARRAASPAISGKRLSGMRDRPGTASTPQACDIGGVMRRAAFEHRGPGDKHIGAGRNRPARRLGRDAAIDLERDVAARPFDELRRRLDLLQLAGDEGLSAEARITLMIRTRSTRSMRLS